MTAHQDADADEAFVLKACDECGWVHGGGEHPPRERWRSWEQRAREAETVIAEMGRTGKAVGDAITLELMCAYQAAIRGDPPAVVRGRLGFPDVEVRRIEAVTEPATCHDSAKPDPWAGDPGKWPCKCGRQQKLCPCFMEGCEVGARHAEPSIADEVRREFPDMHDFARAEITVERERAAAKAGGPRRR